MSWFISSTLELNVFFLFTTRGQYKSTTLWQMQIQTLRSGLVSTNGVETYAALESFDALRVELTTVCRLAQTLELLLKFWRVMLWQNLISRPAIGRRTVCPRLGELHVPLVRVSVELLRTHRRDITDEGVEQDLLHLMTADWGQRSPVQTELPPRRREEQIWTHICNRSVRWQTHTHAHARSHSHALESSLKVLTQVLHTYKTLQAAFSHGAERRVNVTNSASLKHVIECFLMHENFLKLSSNSSLTEGFSSRGPLPQSLQVLRLYYINVNAVRT